MTFGISSEFNSTLSQLQGIFNQLGGTSIKGGSYVNSIFNMTNDIEQIANGDATQKANGVQSLVQEAFSLIERIVNIQSKVNKKVNDDKKNSQEIVDETEDLKADLEEAIVETGEEISAETKIINTATKTANQAQEDLLEKQEEINNIIAQIAEKQEKLKEATTIEEQEALLEEISGLSGQILTLTANITDIQETVAEAAKNIENAVTVIEEAKGNSVKIQENGEMLISAATQKAVETTSDVASTQADGVKNISLGTALESSAAAESVIPIIGGALAGQTAQKGAELISAGTTETTGSVANLKTLLQGIGGIVDNTSLLNSFKNAIGSALENFNTAVGTWNTAIEPVITSIGSFTSEAGYIVQAENLNTAIESDKAKIGSTKENNVTTEAKTNKSNAEQEENSQTTAIKDLVTPEFKFNFGI